MTDRERLQMVLRETVPRIDWETKQQLMENGLLDSLDLLMVVARLHTEFQVEIPPEELTADNFNSADAIWQLCERYRGKAKEIKMRRLV